MSISDSQERDVQILERGHIVAGRYEILETLGTGGMGCVYLAQDNVLGDEQVAIKILHSDYVHERKHTQRFLREVQLMRKVTHPTVVRTYDVGADGDVVYFTMEYVSGKSLEELMETSAFPKDNLTSLIIQVCEGLEAIHEANIVHRDLKPGNIIVTEDGCIKITDFGVARPETSKLTAHNEIIGSSLYMAPEIWLGRKLSGSVDLYSLGIILYELLTGALPFDGDSPAAVMQQHLDRIPKPPRDIVKSIKPWLNKLILKLMAKSILDRPGSAREVIEYIKTQTERRSVTLGNDDIAPAQGATSGVSQTFISTLEEISESVTASPPRPETPSKSSFLSFVEYGFQRPLRSLLISKVRRRFSPSGPIKGILPIVTQQLSALISTLCILILLEAVLSYVFGSTLEPIPELDPHSTGLVVKELGVGAALKIGIPYAALFVIFLSLPATLIGAISGSIVMALRAFFVCVFFQVISGFVLLLYHLQPVLKSSHVNGHSLISAAGAAAEQLSQIAVFSPFVSSFKHTVVTKGLFVVPGMPAPVTGNILLGLIWFVYVGVIGYIIWSCFKSKLRQSNFTHIAVALALIALLLFEVNSISLGRGQMQTFSLFAFDFSIPKAAWPIVLKTWGGLYAVLLVLFARAELKRKYG